MKTYTKKQFQKEVLRVMKELEIKELVTVRDGLYMLYHKLNNNTDAFKVERLNALSDFLLTIACMSMTETERRIKSKEVPY